MSGLITDYQLIGFRSYRENSNTIWDLVNSFILIRIRFKWIFDLKIQTDLFFFFYINNPKKFRVFKMGEKSIHFFRIGFKKWIEFGSNGFKLYEFLEQNFVNKFEFF